MERTDFCISVLTTPGLTDTAITSGSSTGNSVAKCSIAAFEQPYAPQPVKCFEAAPEDVRTIRPLEERSDGNAAVI